MSSINRLNETYRYRRAGDKKRPSYELTLFHFTGGTIRGDRKRFEHSSSP